eukprot:TRINITY_DN78160_c0_g1_i1.p1 TRINITY_DN78160_c0_g1~~TRINITY_DN78160_c0_g1_i1.p1  ORF type:complete len:410 (-),score=85.33 TRINITY_DN78160_c0_g1_i1:294-1463(-)
MGLQPSNAITCGKESLCFSWLLCSMRLQPSIALARGKEPLWQSPLELAGVKSRKRSIFEVSLGSLDSTSSGINRICGLKLTLGSRVCAIGAAGRIAVDLLLDQRKLKSGKVQKHESLHVVHLGPHLASEASSVEEHLASCAVALATRPQVVVLETRSSRAAEAWNAAFDELLGEALQSFRGALIVAGEECPSQLVDCQCWSGTAGWLWQRPMSPRPELLEDLFSSEAAAEPEPALLQEIKALGEAAFFGENLVEKVLDRGWTLAVLVEPIASQQGTHIQTRRLCGFMCYYVRKSELHIARLAVVPQDRGRGHGKGLMQWALEKAATLPRSQCAWISLSSLDEAVPFYEQFGFTDMTCDDLEDDEHFQTWMELKNESIVPDDPVEEGTED